MITSVSKARMRMLEACHQHFVPRDRPIPGMGVPVAASAQIGKATDSVAQSYRVARRDQDGSLVVRDGLW